MPKGELRFSRKGADFGDAVTVRIAQQRDPFGARHCPAGLFLKLLEEPSLDALRIIGPRRRVGFGDEDVAIRQHVQPARMIEVTRESHHRGARRGVGCLVRRPAFRVDDVDEWNQGAVGDGSTGLAPVPSRTLSLARAPHAR